MISGFEPGRLRLTLHVDDDGSADLFATATSNGFSGHGSAWVNICEIQDFAARIAKYPLDADVEIAGGFYSESVPEKLSQTHLSLRVYLLDGRGQIGVHVNLADPHHADDRIDAIKSVDLEVLTTYNRIERFSREILGLIDGRTNEALLEEELL
ncbi:hypothetical protein [Rhodopirellula bahusiensis]|uniref:Uncharacterized protein n=1 Tax=Rhodopirellula bahusiensis TaxID=2014065 RepID=A0A2G1VXT0_9BACT|nr:hypothetical protein [Rhodopirellula bahusiensis]PHQ31586.1 hypothetical protein CEE69_30365 [Rhodopirellula bahusiensis]